MASVIPSPVQYECQKNFVVIITDGEPTKDDFDTTSASEDLGFGQFAQLIGDYNADGEVETGYTDEGALYLDDIAKFMASNDFDTTLTGDQTIDVYTIGFTTNGPANALLAKTATQGNGIFFTSNSAEELTVAITGAITNILEKAQSFTAATVPSARTTDGGASSRASSSRRRSARSGRATSGPSRSTRPATSSTRTATARSTTRRRASATAARSSRRP